jgi:hypothetical protein
LCAVDRRVAFGQIAAVAAFAVPAIANADGAVSKSTVFRARGVYGNRIASLKGAVDAGDFAAIVAEKNAFVLFNSGAYPSIKERASKSAAIEATNKIFAAVKSQDKSALKSAYDAYVKQNDVVGYTDSKGGQTYSSDADYRVRTPQAYIYQR